MNLLKLERRRGKAKIHLADIQGNVLRGYGFPHTGYVFVKVSDSTGGRAWLSELTPLLTSAEPWTSRPETTLNIAMTHAGLRALGVPDGVLRSFPKEFREGMAARAPKLGDEGSSAPENWEAPLGSGDLHVLAMIDAQTDAQLKLALGRLQAGIDLHPGVAVATIQRTAVLPEGREHFGFADGFAQPSVEGSGLHPKPGQGTPLKAGRWRPLKPGEFVLGYEDEDGVLPDGPDGGLARNGTFMVYRKLYQDVALFRTFISETAARYGWDRDWLAAKIVGRWADGTPMTVSPDAPDRSISQEPDKIKINDFSYKGDLDGINCPLGAHVRRANPRDALGWEGKRSFRHRIIRRGMPYGPPLPPAASEGDDIDRGLIFVCFNASIARQFETVQHQWCSDGNLFGLGNDTDFLLGHDGDSGKMTIQGNPPRFVAPRKPLVVTRGGEYLFLPGLDAVRMIAGGVPEIQD